MPLPTPNYRNANPPEWFRMIRANEQERLNGLYSFALQNWQSAASGWLDDQARKREASADPANYRPEPFTRPIPTREVLDIGEDGSMYTWQEPVDPNVHTPVLPPYAPPQVAPNAGFKSTAGEVTAAQNAKDAALFNLLLQIQRDVAAIKSKVGA